MYMLDVGVAYIQHIHNVARASKEQHMRHLIRRILFYIFAVWVAITVGQVIGQDIWWSIMLGAVAVVISFALGCLVGIITAWKRGTTLDTVLSPMMNFLSAIPYFWLALLSLYLFSYLLNWFPLSGGYDSANIDPGWSLDFIGSVIQ